MLISVKLYGTLRRFSHPGKPGFWEGDIPPGTKLIELINIIGSNIDEVAAASINGVVSGFDAEIPSGAEIVLVTNIGAG